MAKYTVQFVVLALGLGAITGGIDLMASEVQPAVICLVVLSAILAYLQPQNPWLWALILGSSILVTHLVARAAGYRPPYPVEPNVFATLLAFIPASVGAAGGWLLSRL